MTDRIKGCVVTFSEDFRTDDAESLLNAIRQLKGVAAVDVSICSPEDHMNRTRIRIELGDKLREVLATLPHKA